MSAKLTPRGVRRIDGSTIDLRWMTGRDRRALAATRRHVDWRNLRRQIRGWLRGIR